MGYSFISHSSPFILLILTASVFGDLNSSQCLLEVISNPNDTVSDQFASFARRGAIMVVFHLKIIQNDSTIVSLNIQKPDTFMPDQWVWVKDGSKHLLTVPQDYDILSLGLLRLTIFDLEIYFKQTPSDCHLNLAVEDLINATAALLINNVTFDVDSGVSSFGAGDQLCRSAFAFYETGNGSSVGGAGWKCCSQTRGTTLYSCDVENVTGWKLLWYGPVGLLGWVYVLLFLKIYRIYRRKYRASSELGKMVMEKIVEDLKVKIIQNMQKARKRIPFVQKPAELISRRESHSFMDVLGVTIEWQEKISGFINVASILFLFACYCGYCAGVIYIYSLKSSSLRIFREGNEVSINVFGHLGWLFVDDNIWLRRYAAVETAYTFLVPFLLLGLYASLSYDPQSATAKLQPVTSSPHHLGGAYGNNTSSETLNWDTSITANSARSAQFKRVLVHVVEAITFFLIFVYVITIVCIYVTYCLFFIVLGIITNIVILAPWLIPIVLGLIYLSSAFSPATYYYGAVCAKFFCVASAELPSILIVKERELFLPRKIIMNFYHPRSRGLIMACIQRQVIILTGLTVILLVVLSMQYPNFYNTTNIPQLLGINLLFVVPWLSRVLTGGLYNQKNDEVLEVDILRYLKGLQPTAAVGGQGDGENGAIKTISGGDGQGSRRITDAAVELREVGKSDESLADMLSSDNVKGALLKNVLGQVGDVYESINSLMKKEEKAQPGPSRY